MDVMNPERHQFLSLPCRPARLSTDEAAWLLGFFPHEIPILIARNLLKPLGSPAPNAAKYFATVDLERLLADSSWLTKASSTIARYWRDKNQRRPHHSVTSRLRGQLE
jgi:hypothetical protein